MDNLAHLDKIEEIQNLEEYKNMMDKSDVRQSVRNSLDKLNEVESNIDKLENKNFVQRAWGGVTGQNGRDMVATMRDLTQVQQLTIQLVLSIAASNAKSQESLDDILDEREGAKGTHTKIVNHIDFLYEQVETIKKSAPKPKTYKTFLPIYFLVGMMILVMIYIMVKI